MANLQKIYVIREGKYVRLRCPTDKRYNDLRKIPADWVGPVTAEALLESAQYIVLHEMKLSTVMHTFVYLEVLPGGLGQKAGAA